MHACMYVHMYAYVCVYNEELVLKLACFGDFDMEMTVFDIRSMTRVSWREIAGSDAKGIMHMTLHTCNAA